MFFAKYTCKLGPLYSVRWNGTRRFIRVVANTPYTEEFTVLVLKPLGYLS
jgi:hypothetical protein